MISPLRSRWRNFFRRKQNKPAQQELVILNDSSPVSCICLYTGHKERLEEAIYSFLQQDYGGTKELIILNDDPAQTLVFDHPEVIIINLPQPTRFRRKKWEMAVRACKYDLIFVWNADDISLPHRISISVKKMAQAGDQSIFTPSTIFIWENEWVSGLYHNLFHQGSCWSRGLFDQVGGLKKIEHNPAIIEPQLLSVDQPHYHSLTDEETYYLFRGLDLVTRKTQSRSGEIRLGPHWQADYPKLVQDHLTSGIAANIDRYLPELEFRQKNKVTRFGYLGPRRYYVFEDRRLAYISTAKVACTSIKTAMMRPYGIRESVHHEWPHIYRGMLKDEHQDFFTFSFVRNPFDRLVSGYRNKIISFPRQQRAEFGQISANISFAEFVTEVVKRPDCLINGHFQSQFTKLYQNGELLVDYLGRFENLAEDWLPIANRFGFDAQLPHKMKSTDKKGVHKDYRAYYTEELVHLVYNRFRADVEVFGYQEAYEELLAFVKGKQGKM